MHPAALPDDLLLATCELRRGRGSGPGGQHKNKVSTEVTLTHRPTGLVAQAGERRSGAENHKVAVLRLRLVLALEVRAPWAAPSELWRSRCRDGHVAVNPAHRDFPAMLAEALDALEAGGHDPRVAGERLGCSASQLIKLVKEHAPAFSAWNRRRAALGQHALK